MDKKKLIKGILWLVNIIVILLLVWSLVNYKFLENEVVGAVQVGGLIAMVLIVFILEGAPVFVGGSVAVASLMAMGGFNIWLLLSLFLLSAILGNFFYYYLGYFSGKKILRYFDKKDVKKYEDLFKKYGLWAMVIMAVSPIPYLPTIAGVFRMSPRHMFIETLIVRLIRHLVVFFFWVVVFGLI